jgi:hypothetical protein
LNHYIIGRQFYSSDELYHHGILGMKWGVRRYQNEDGSLTNTGKHHKEDNGQAVNNVVERGSSVTDSLLSSYGDYNWNSLKQANSDLLNQTLNELLKGL